MILFLKIFTGSLLGYISHYLHATFEDMRKKGTPHGWLNMARYTVGGCVALPVYIMIRRDVDEHEQIEMDIKAYILAFFAVSLGVAVGYLRD